MSILNELAGNSFMIFCSTCNNAQRVALLLRNLGITAIPLHGQMSQVTATEESDTNTVLMSKTFCLSLFLFCFIPYSLSGSSSLSWSEQTSRSAQQVQIEVSIGAAGDRRGIQRTRHSSCGLRHQLRHPHTLEGTLVLTFTLLVHLMISLFGFDLTACLSAIVGLYPQSRTNSQSRTVWEIHHFCHSVRFLTSNHISSLMMFDWIKLTCSVIIGMMWSSSSESKA